MTEAEPLLAYTLSSGNVQAEVERDGAATVQRAVTMLRTTLEEQIVVHDHEAFTFIAY